MALEQWTDEQEIALLKAVVRWKPVGPFHKYPHFSLLLSNPTFLILGMHRHFRMLAIRDYMITQGVINLDQEHTKTPGIWAKLGSLYNLPILDDREDSIMNDIPADDVDGGIIELYSPFSLPEEEYGDLMFAKRINENGSESPERDPSTVRESTVADTDEPGSSPAPGRRGAAATARSTRTPKARGRRISKLQNEVESSSRRTSKATSVNEDETMEDVGEDVGEEAESEEEGEQSGGGEDEEISKVKRRKVTANRGGRGRGNGRRSGRKK